MANEKRNLKTSEKQNVDGGFYIGKDLYNISEYNKAGVTWEHNFFHKDRYFYDGQEITQGQAEGIVMAYRKLIGEEKVKLSKDVKK